MAGTSLVLLLAGALFAASALVARNAVDYRFVPEVVGGDVSDEEQREELIAQEASTLTSRTAPS